MRIQTGFEIIVWVETSCHMTERVSRVRNYYKLSIRAFAMAGGWTAEMTPALVSVWGQANVQSELDGVVRNRTIFERISRELKEMGIHRTWQQCRTKILKNHAETLSEAATAQILLRGPSLHSTKYTCTFLQCVVTIACGVPRVAVT